MQELQKISRWPMYSPPTTLQTRQLVLLGEAPGAEEEAKQKPFVGASGSLLRKQLLNAAGLNADDFHILNVFTSRPPNNDLKSWTLTKTEAKRLGLDWMQLGPDIGKRYLHPDHAPQVQELHRRLSIIKPSLIICLGGTAMWALTGNASVGTFRGTFFKPSRVQLDNCAAIATYHPAAILRQWSFLPIAWADLTKARLHLADQLPAPLRREFIINPSFAEIEEAWWKLKASGATLGVDIETSPRSGMMTTISFSTPTYGICIPLWDKETGESYWPTTQDECKAWRWIERYARLPNPKVMQNGLYDMQWLLDGPLAIRCRNTIHDTAILQHALQPELPKALGTIASLYLNEPSWKQMRTAAKDEVKADD